MKQEFFMKEVNLTDINCLQISRKYVQFRPNTATHDQFFAFYKNGRYMSQPVGINSIPKLIVGKLGLVNPDQEDRQHVC